MKSPTYSILIGLLLSTSLSYCDFLDFAGSILWHRGEQFKEMATHVNINEYINNKLEAPYGKYVPYAGWTLLMMAAAKGYTDIVKFLLEQGADPNIKNNQNKTAAQIAQENGHDALAKKLRKASNKLTVLVAKAIAEDITAGRRNISQLTRGTLPTDVIQHVAKYLPAEQRAHLEKILESHPQEPSEVQPNG
jgi:Ankyrin repeats (many copies)